MANKLSRRDMFKDSAKILGGFIIVAPAFRALAQTSNPSPLNQPAAPGTANPTENDPSQNPAQNRVGDQFKRHQPSKTLPPNSKVFQKGSYYQSGYPKK